LQAIVLHGPGDVRSGSALGAGAPQVFVTETNSGRAAKVAALDDCVQARRAEGTGAEVALHMGCPLATPSLWTEKDLTIMGSWCYKTHDWHQAVGLVAAGRLPVEKVATSRI
jgi:threonine dehydrogenase-like Zn-dependent dehydrogenase